MDQKALGVFDEMPVGKAVMKNVIPSVASMLLILVYNLADTFFIGQTGDDLQVAAISLAMPVFMIFMVLGTLFGVGGTSVISRAMGRGDKDYAKHVSAFCFWSSIAIGFAFAISIQFVLDDLVKLIGASSASLVYTKNYLSIVVFSSPFLLVSFSFSNIIRAEGQASKAVMGIMIGNVLNIILDPIFILVLGLGTTGAAIATVIGNVVGGMYYLLFFLRGKSILSIKIKDFKIGDKVLKSVFAIGVPASLGSLIMSFSQIFMNNQMSKYGDVAVAAMGVALRVTMIIATIAIALGQGIQPLLGFSVGARNWDRFKGILRFSVLLAIGVGLTLTGLCFIFVDSIVRVFLSQPEAINYGVSFARILLSTSFLFGLFYCFVNALQAMGAAVSSLIVNVSRQGLIYLPALLILHSILGTVGIVWAYPVADVLALIIASALCLHSFRKLKKKNEDMPVNLMPNDEMMQPEKLES